MRIAVMTDAHANLPALRAALREIEARGCDVIYHTGDAIGIGPYPAETLDMILNAPKMRCVMGNHDAYFAFGLLDGWPFDGGEMEHQRWVHAQLDPALVPAVAAWTAVADETWDGVHAVFLHYALGDRPGVFAPIIAAPQPEDLDRLFAAYPARLVFYGHHHPRSDLAGRARYVNPGALGCHSAPLARYALVETWPSGRFTIDHRAVPYDAAPLLAELERRHVPQRDFIRRVFLRQDAG